jgi:hypothetical protein
MDTEYAQLRLWRNTLKKLRRIYAETGESIISIIDRLADQELEKLNNANSQDLQVQAVPKQKE